MSDLARFLCTLDCGPASAWVGPAREALVSADAAIDRLRRVAAEGGSLDLARLAAARRDASDTLRRNWRDPTIHGQDLARAAWDRASSMVSTALVEGRSVDLPAVDRLAATVRGQSIDPSASRAASFRNVPMFNGPSAYAPHELVEALHQAMGERLLSRLGESHPIVEAALAARWLVSVHPYLDGNGRTSRLVADWILGAAGYVPATYANPLAAFVACRFEQPNAADPVAAIRVVARGVERSVAFLVGTTT
jgi:hypothetical protein